jgi:eukaryotic-like serine/threonine-protein kinase
VKLSDFGIARAADSISMTGTGELKGKAEYLAPELFKGVRATHRSDLYSLAITMVHAALLNSPFRRETPAATMQAVQNGALPDLLNERPELGEMFAAAVARAGAHNPDERFEDAAAFAQALPSAPPEEADKLGNRVLGNRVRTLCALFLSRLNSEADAVTRSTQQQPASIEAASDLPADTGTGVSPRKIRGRVLRWGGVLAGLSLAAVLWAHFTKPSTVDREAAPAPAPVTSGPPLALPPTPASPAPLDSNARREERRPAVAAGFLSIDAKPWANVYVNGKLVGETPIDSYPVVAGAVNVKFVNPELKKTVSKRFQIGKGERLRLREDLR